MRSIRIGTTICSIGVVATRDLAKVESRVQIPYIAPLYPGVAQMVER